MNEVVLSLNGGQWQTKGVSKVLIKVFKEKRQDLRFHLEDVLYVPQYKFSLKSVDKVLEKGHSIPFKDKKAS